MRSTTLVVASALLSLTLFAGTAAAGPTSESCDGGIEGCTLGYIPYCLEKYRRDPSFQYLGFCVDKYRNGVLTPAG